MKLTLRLISNMATEIGQQQNNMKRFYKQATIVPNKDKKHPLHNHLLLLDGRTVKTPYRNQLALPSKTLGFLVANEFNRQVKYLKTGEMPILALCRTAVDADIQGHLAQHLKHTIIEYLKTDTILFEHDIFEKEHQKLARPLIDFFRSRFNMQITPSVSIQAPQVKLNDAFIHWVQSLSNWQLIGMETMTIWMKSTIAAFAVAESNFDPVMVQKATYLEEVTQMKSSGEVQEKLMDFNQINLMVSCGEIMYKHSASDLL